MKVVNRMCPYHEDIVYVTPPCMKHVTKRLSQICLKLVTLKTLVILCKTLKKEGVPSEILEKKYCYSTYH